MVDDDYASDGAHRNGGAGSVLVALAYLDQHRCSDVLEYMIKIFDKYSLASLLMVIVITKKEQLG